jgi:hypothetical protein
MIVPSRLSLGRSQCRLVALSYAKDVNLSNTTEPEKARKPCSAAQAAIKRLRYSELPGFREPVEARGTKS